MLYLAFVILDIRASFAWYCLQISSPFFWIEGQCQTHNEVGSLKVTVSSVVWADKLTIMKEIH